MKKIKSILLLLVIFVIFPFGIVDVLAVAGDDVNSYVTEDVGKTYIPFTKNWQNVPADKRPSFVRVKLYKYIGDEFIVENAIEIETKDITSDMNWKYNFDISSERLFDESLNAYKFKVVEELINGYEEVESLHIDPNVIFNPPKVSSEWKRIEPCSSIDISTVGSFKSIIIAKMTGNQDNKFIIWTVEPLSNAERRMVYESSKKINGFGNPSETQFINDFIFISGNTGEYYHNGFKVITVDENHINFEGGTKVWSLFATSMYEKSSTDANSSSITNTAKKKEISVNKEWVDSNNSLGLRPDSITIQLLKDSEIVEEVELSQTNNWTYVFKDLFEYENGDIVEYTIQEVPIDNYKSDISVNEDGSFIITNTCTLSYILPETGSNGMLLIYIVTIILLGMPLVYSVYTFVKKRY